MKKFIKVLIVILVFIILVIIGLFAVKKLFSEEKEKKVITAKHLDTVEGFDYKLYDNSTELYKDLYYELKDVLKQEEIDYGEYAELVGKMFIADYYTLSNKVTNQDIGGLEFFYSKRRDNFKLFASNNAYKNVENNVYGDRKQELPTVTEITSCTATKSSYKYESDDTDEDKKISISDDESYIVKISWKYDKSYSNFPTNATLRLVHEDKYLSIVSVE